MLAMLTKRKITRNRRTFRVRKKLRGTKEKPRLSVNKSNKNLFIQLIDDENACTIAAIGTNSKEFKKEKKSKKTAALLGKKIALMAKEKKIETIIFDRGRYKYHGLLAELANGARSEGLKFQDYKKWQEKKKNKNFKKKYST